MAGFSLDGRFSLCFHKSVMEQSSALPAPRWRTHAEAREADGDDSVVVVAFELALAAVTVVLSAIAVAIAALLAPVAMAVAAVIDTVSPAGARSQWRPAR